MAQLIQNFYPQFRQCFKEMLHAVIQRSEIEQLNVNENGSCQIYEMNTIFAGFETKKNLKILKCINISCDKLTNQKAPFDFRNSFNNDNCQVTIFSAELVWTFWVSSVTCGELNRGHRIRRRTT